MSHDAASPAHIAETVLTQRIQAPLSSVQLAWSDPVHLEQWWAPAGYTARTHTFALRAGHCWHFSLIGADGEADQFVIWDEVSPHSIRYHMPGTTLEDGFSCHVTLAAEGDHTLLTMRCHSASTTASATASRLQSDPQFLARLARYVESGDLQRTDASAGYRLTMGRDLDVPVQTVWRCFTEPALLQQWWCPRPWGVQEAVMDLRAGGRFFTLMVGPNGESVPNEGSYLLVEPLQRLVFTNALAADWQPIAGLDWAFTAEVYLTALPNGFTRYTAIGRHATAQDRDTHAGMGFHEGWGMASDQLLALAQSL